MRCFVEKKTPFAANLPTLLVHVLAHSRSNSVVRELKMNSGQFPEQFSFLQSTSYCILLHSMCNAPRTIKLEENRATNVRMNRFRLQEPQVLRNISSRTSKVFRLHKSHLEATASTIRYSKQSWRLYLFLIKKVFFGSNRHLTMFELAWLFRVTIVRRGFILGRPTLIYWFSLLIGDCP